MNNSHNVVVSDSMTKKTPVELRDEGIAALNRRDPDAAEAAFRALLAFEPNNIYAVVGQGLIARLRGRREEAMARFEAAAVACPEHPWPLLEIGAEFDASGRIDDAEASLRRALELSSGHYHVLMALWPFAGTARRSRGRRRDVSQRDGQRAVSGGGLCGAGGGNGQPRAT